jgi:hypothetical protein
MNSMTALLVVFWLALLSLAAGAPAALAMRCEGRLVSIGDRRFDVLAACGEPSLRVPVQVEMIGVYALLPYEEIWYYNFGPRRFLQQLRFRHGRLTAIESTGYGFNPEAPGPCRPEDLRRGMTHLELVARCGEPIDQAQRVRWLPSLPGPPFIRGTMVIEEEWLYDFGPHHFYRVLTLIDGSVVEIKTGGRGIHRN